MSFDNLYFSGSCDMYHATCTLACKKLVTNIGIPIATRAELPFGFGPVVSPKNVLSFSFAPA
jgi:hypothetical protein